MASSTERSLFLAISKSDWSTAKWLAGQGKGVNFVHVDGNSMLHLAAKGGNTSLVKVLLDKGADFKTVNSNQQTPLFVAVFNNAPLATVELLVNAGSDVNCVDKQGWTPLIAATFKNASPEVIALLMEHGADRNAALPDGKTVLDFAREKPVTFEQTNLVELIRCPTSHPKPNSLKFTSFLTKSRRTTAASSVYSEAYTVKTTMSAGESGVSSDSLSSASSEASSLDNALSAARVYISFSAEKHMDSTGNDAIEKVHALVDQLKGTGVQVIVDFEPTLKQAKMFQVAKDLDSTTLFLPCITTDYMHRVFAGCMDAAFLDLCAVEFSEAQERLGEDRILPIVLDEVLTDSSILKGPVGLTLYNREYVDFTRSSLLEKTVSEVVRTIRMMD